MKNELSKTACGLICAVSIITLISCGPQGYQASSLENPKGPTGSEMSSGTGILEFTGMGGADTGLPSQRPGSTEETVEIPELYYTVYTIQKGDIIGHIADQFGVSQDAIISINKIRSTRTLQIGQYLKVPSINGIVYTVKKGDTSASIADRYRISLEKMAVVNNITDDSINAGSLIFLPDAKLDWVTLQEINGDLFKKPLRGSYYISSRYGWRSNPFTSNRTFHNGVDLATASGTPIYAAMEGTVSKTGFDVTYGNFVIITHHSGYQTMYGHMSAILTSPGKHVGTSTVIGKVGNTGQSTGPHVHFTVYKNRSTTNPSYLWN